jgi:broad specificity phosphatase PhoE
LHDAEYQSLESFPAWPEDYEHMRERVSRTVRHIADAHEGPVLVVSHGNPNLTAKFPFFNVSF